MSLRQTLFAAIGILAIAIAACSTLKTKDSDEDIRLFLGSFEASLKLPDAEILKQFKVKQTREAVLSAIHVLQNKESEYIVCTMAYQTATIERTNDSIKVQIPAVFTTRNLEDESREESTLTLWLEEKQHGFAVVRLGGEKFYDDFTMLKRGISWNTERLDGLKRREAIYTKAGEIQKHYDSVVWYTTYQGKNYFYVINGHWNIEEDTYGDFLNNKNDYKMGLADETGALIIPVEYKLIGTPGFVKPQWIEVTKNGKAGYFNLETRKLTIQPAYDMIIPYEKENLYAITQTDSTYGWIDSHYQYHEGFYSPELEKWVNTYQFLSGDLSIESGKQAFCEMASSQYAGWCVVMPPSYYVKTGLFQSVEFDLTSADMPGGGSVGDMKASGTFFEKITDGISALITTVQKNYVAGRESFYSTNRLAFVSPNHELLTVSDVRGGGFLQMKRLSEKLVEIKTKPYPLPTFDIEFEPETEEIPERSREYDMPIYTYFMLDKTIIEQESHRNYNFTQFAKLDSSYITGTFHYWDGKSAQASETSILTLETLEYMRDEIFADYGYKFTDSLNIRRFDQHPQNISDIKEVRAKLNDTDRHNIAFLEKVIGLMASRQSGKSI